jgi:single-stranded-DNA-specific exonuclease
MEKKWKILTPDQGSVSRICRGLKCSRIMATILANRNILSSEDIFAYFDSSFQRISSPFCIQDIEVAAARICTAIKNREKILIFGDYDVDGITATTMVFQFLKDVGAEVSYYIPHRVREGYGMRPHHISHIAIPDKIQLIITVDCGVSSHDAVDAANSAGIDVVVTDHHRITEALPNALAVINPERMDCGSGLEHLAGVGVAFYLLVAVRKHLRDLNHWNGCDEPNLKDLCDLVALGTIADLVPLVAENRIFVKKGLEVMNTGKRTGIKALIDICKLGNKHIEPGDIAFRLAPRLNAAGRMRHADLAVQLLMNEDAGSAEKAARDLGELNRSRQIIEKETLEDIDRLLADNPDLLDKKTIVLSHRNWHVGLLGIVASRIAERYYRPVILLSEKTIPWKGSARSISEFDLYQAIDSCSDILEAFGGHKMAAGLSVMPDKVRDFVQKFETIAGTMMKEEPVQPTILIDQELNLNQVSNQIIDELDSLQPFGKQNREPLFMARDVQVHFSSLIGKNHRRMRLGHSTGKLVNGIHFNVAPEIMNLSQFDKMAFRLRWNHWNGKKTAQVIVEDVV